ncbi:MAG: helix-turn-helix transcriptional regulator [Rhodospirillales bacterium]|nr:helix-turn-helix transcriptional regulator [Rhodospirillales bacterium]
MTITAAQIRGARGLLNWNQGDLSDRTGISATSIGSIENGQTQPRESTLSTIQKTFEDAGIEFSSRDSVRRRANEIVTYTGRSGFWEFYDDIYETVKDSGGSILVSNVDERDFEKWLGEKKAEHIERMKALKGKIEYKILIREGDTFFPAVDYAEYRWISRGYFSSVPFYVYANKLAIMLFGETPTIIVLDYQAVAATYRAQFQALWDVAEEVRVCDAK